MAPKASPTDTGDSDIPTLTPRETQFLAQAFQCFESQPKINLAKLADMSIYGSPASATTAFHKLRRKLLGDAVLPSATPTKKQKQKKKQAAFAADDDDDDDDDDEDEETALGFKTEGTKILRKRKAVVGAEQFSNAAVEATAPPKKKKKQQEARVSCRGKVAIKDVTAEEEEEEEEAAAAGDEAGDVKSEMKIEEEGDAGDAIEATEEGLV